MTRKWVLFRNIVAVILLGAGLLLWYSAPAQAQCGDTPEKSSCITCHAQENPVYQNGEWHGVHALKDCCANCHGGNCRAQEKELAHENLVAHPLEDIYTNCHACHPNDYQERAAQFALLLGVTPGSSPTATPVPAMPVVEHAIVLPSTPSLPDSVTQPWIFILGGTGFTVLFLLGLWELARHLVAQDKHYKEN
jgi:hypothetical protein